MVAGHPTRFQTTHSLRTTALVNRTSASQEINCGFKLHVGSNQMAYLKIATHRYLALKTFSIKNVNDSGEFLPQMVEGRQLDSKSTSALH